MPTLNRAKLYGSASSVITGKAQLQLSLISLWRQSMKELAENTRRPPPLSRGPFESICQSYVPLSDGARERIFVRQFPTSGSPKPRRRKTGD